MTRRQQIALIVTLSLVPTVAHYVTDTHNGAAHDIFQRLYYLPVILAGLWFGTTGGLVTALAIAVAYFPHAIHGWHGPYSLFYRIMEVFMYVVVGGLTGRLTDRLRASTASEQEARTDVETAYASLRARTDELFSMEEQLRRSERLAALGSLTAGLAHEIRNPLASIQTSIEMLRGQARSGKADPEAPDFAAIIMEETTRLDRILTDFLQFARAEQSRPSEEPHACRVAQAIARTLDLAGPQLERESLRVAFDADSLDILVSVCESHLRQVFLNLILNARDAMNQGGEVRIERLPDDGRHFVVAIEDSGPGIPQEMAQRIFDPFYTTKATGTGLGLSIVERILHSHGGSIRLVGDGDASSRFELRLPKVGA